MQVCEIENKNKDRAFIISLANHIEGGKIQLGTDQKPKDVMIAPETTAIVMKECGEKLAHDWKGEIRIIRKFDRKE